LKYFLAIIVLFVQFFISNFSFAQCKAESEFCVPVDKWGISIGLGVGLYSNPLYGSKGIPLILFPSVTYYGEKVFFQNNTLGYTLLENENIALSLVTKANSERIFFTYSSIQLQDSFVSNVEIYSSTNNVLAKKDLKINPKTVNKRRWALDAGLQVNWFVNESVNAQFQLFYNVNGVYDGLNANAEIMKFIKISPKSILDFTLGVQINSANLVDYYYGVSGSDTIHNSTLYQGELSVNPHVSIGYTNKFSADWIVKTALQRKFLDRNTYSSPLVKDRYINLVFVGFFYEF